MAKPKKRNQWLRSLLAVLLTALVVVGATLAPGFLLQLEQVAIPQGYYTLQQRGNRLDFNEMYYYAGAAISLNRYSGYVEEEMLEEAQILELSFQFRDQYDELTLAGVVPEEFWEIVEYWDYYAPEVWLYKTTVELYEFITVDSMIYNYNGSTSFNPVHVLLDKATDKIFALRLELPHRREIVEKMVEEGAMVLEPYLKAYTTWLELDEVPDWQMEIGSEDIYGNYAMVSLIQRSEEAGVTLRLELYYNGYDDLVSFSADIYPKSYYYW